MAQLDKSGTGCIHLLEKRQHDMLWGIVIPFTKQSESLDPEAYQNTSVVSWFFLVPIKVQCRGWSGSKNLWIIKYPPVITCELPPWYLNFSHRQIHQTAINLILLDCDSPLPLDTHLPLLLGGWKGFRPPTTQQAVLWPSEPSGHCMNCTKSLESKINSCKTWSRKSQTSPGVVGEEISSPTLSLIKFPNQKMWGRKVFRMFLLTVVVYITCWFFDSNGDLSKSLESITISQVNIPSVLAYASLLCPMFIHFLAQQIRPKISPVNLATLLPVAKRRYNSRPSSATSNSATSPVPRRVPSRWKKRFETDPFWMDQGEGLCWYSLQIDVLYKYLATLEYSVV